MPSSKSTPCAACKFVRRKCTEECAFAPYFPPENPQRFASVHRVYGASNVAKLLSELPESKREDAVKSLVSDAEARLKDPVYGNVGFISVLQKKLREVQAEVAKAKKELGAYVSPEDLSNLLANQQGSGGGGNNSNAAFDIRANFPPNNMAPVVIGGHGVGAVGGNNRNVTFDFPANFPPNMVPAAQAVMGGQGSGAVGGNNGNAMCELPANFPPNMVPVAQAVMGGQGSGAVGGNNGNAMFELPANFPHNNIMPAVMGGYGGGKVMIRDPQEQEILQAKQLAMSYRLRKRRANSYAPFDLDPANFSPNNLAGQAGMGGLVDTQVVSRDPEEQEYWEAQQLAAAAAAHQQQQLEDMLFEQQQLEMIHNSGFEAVGKIPGGGSVHGGEVPNSLSLFNNVGSYQMQQQPPQQGGDYHQQQHHHDPPVGTQHLVPPLHPEIEEGRSVGPCC